MLQVKTDASHLYIQSFSIGEQFYKNNEAENAQKIKQFKVCSKSMCTLYIFTNYLRSSDQILKNNTSLER